MVAPGLDMYEMQRKCDLDRWYDALQDVTPRTVFLSLSNLEASVLLDAVKAVLKHPEHFQIDSLLAQDPLRGLITRVERALASFPDGTFPRLGTRSPKDSKIAEKRGQVALGGAAGVLPPPRDFNEEMLRAIQAQVVGLRACNAREVFELFLTSTRVLDDLEDASAHRDPPGIVLRAFEPFDPATELRLFVKDNRVVAVSQYNHMVVSDALVTRGEEFLQTALGLHARIKDRLPLVQLGSYILDMGFLRGDPSTPRVIEVNPYCVGTGAGLFSWREDFAMGEKVPSKLEFRVRTSPLQKRRGAH